MSVRRPVLTPDHPAPGAAAHRQAGYPFSLAGTAASDHHPLVAGVGWPAGRRAAHRRHRPDPAAAGTSVLQSAYQRGDVLTAGTATIMTNAVPITARFVLFGQRLPHGIRAVLQLAAFACLVASAVALGRQRTPGSEPH